MPKTNSGTFNAAVHQQFLAEHKPTGQAGAGSVAIAPDYIILKIKSDTLYGVVTYDYKPVGDTRSFKGAWVENVQPNGEVKKRYVKLEELFKLRKNGTPYIPVAISVALRCENSWMTTVPAQESVGTGRQRAILPDDLGDPVSKSAKGRWQHFMYCPGPTFFLPDSFQSSG